MLSTLRDHEYYLDCSHFSISSKNEIMSEFAICTDSRNRLRFGDKILGVIHCQGIAAVTSRIMALQAAQQRASQTLIPAEQKEKLSEHDSRVCTRFRREQRREARSLSAGITLVRDDQNSEIWSKSLAATIVFFA